MSPKTRRFALRHSSDKLLPNSVLKCVAQHDSVVVILIVSRIDQRQRAFACERAKLAQQFLMGRQFATIAKLELLPARRIVPKPAAKLGARRDLLQPAIDRGVRLAQAPRPQAIDEDAQAVFGRWPLISPLQTDIQLNRDMHREPPSPASAAGRRRAHYYAVKLLWAD